MGWNGGNQYITYVQLEENTLASDVEQQFPDFLWPHINKDFAADGWRIDASLQPLSDLHLKHNPYSANLRLNLIVTFAMALLILIIACINFINISVVQAHRRGQGSRRAQSTWCYKNFTR